MASNLNKSIAAREMRKRKNGKATQHINEYRRSYKMIDNFKTRRSLGTYNMDNITLNMKKLFKSDL